MPQWVCYLVITLLAGTSIYFGVSAYRAGRKLIRVYLIMTVFLTVASSRSLAILLQATGLDKTWNINVGASINANTWITELGIVLIACLASVLIYLLERQQSKTEDQIRLMQAGYQLFEEFKAVVQDNMTVGLEPADIARNRGIALEKVSHIVMCYAWIENRQRMSRVKDSDVG